MSLIRPSQWIFVGSLCLLLCTSAFVLSQERSDTRKVGTTANTQGRAVFAANCASCHGLDGLGTQRAPNIITADRAQLLSSQQILRIVSLGIPSAGMPAFRSLGNANLKSVARYLKNLQGNVGLAPLPGNPNRGKQIFSGLGGCSSCHMVAGSGGFIASDLTGYARTHTTDQIRAAITKPEESNSAKRLVTVTSANGRQYKGIVRNEDNFSMQLQGLDGSFYFLSKAELQRIDRGTTSIMPSDYGSKLSPDQLNDLLSYLLVTKASEPVAARKDRAED